MQANVETAKVFVGDVSTAYERIKSWTVRVLDRENLKDLALVSATLGGVGILQYALYRTLENWTITGGGVASFGFF